MLQCRSQKSLLQKTFFNFLHVTTSYDLSAVFLVPKNSGYLSEIIQLLICAACSHKDILVRKSCVQVFIKLIKNWCTGPNGDEKVPGFRSFIIENFAVKCCFYSKLQDTHTCTLFGEIVVAQKAIYEKCGDVFILHLVTNIFPVSQCPKDLAEKSKLNIDRNYSFRWFTSLYFGSPSHRKYNDRQNILIFAQIQDFKILLTQRWFLVNGNN